MEHIYVGVVCPLQCNIAISDEKCLHPLSLFLNMFVCVQYIMGWFQIKINTFSKTSSPVTTLTTSYDDVFALNTSGIWIILHNVHVYSSICILKYKSLILYQTKPNIIELQARSTWSYCSLQLVGTLLLGRIFLSLLKLMCQLLYTLHLSSSVQS